MAYLHCHNCDFSQDDFWSLNGWNPISFLEDFKKELILDDLEEVFYCDLELDESGKISRRELLARHFENAAKKIRNIKYRTFEEFKKNNPGRICPICGKKELDID